MADFPTGSAVARALRRDVGIITVPRGQVGYNVSNGMKGVTAPSISVTISDLPDSGVDVRRARTLRDRLVELGWDVELADGSSIVYVNRVGDPPSLEKVSAKYGHLREAKRQQVAEELARADVTDVE